LNFDSIKSDIIVVDAEHGISSFAETKLGISHFYLVLSAYSKYCNFKIGDMQPLFPNDPVCEDGQSTGAHTFVTTYTPAEDNDVFVIYKDDYERGAEESGCMLIGNPVSTILRMQNIVYRNDTLYCEFTKSFFTPQGWIDNVKVNAAYYKVSDYTFPI
jgi:hypothetical protein